MTNQKIFEIALAQSAIECGCRPEDFLGDGPVITRSRSHPQARRYLSLPLDCGLVSYGCNIVAQCSPELEKAVKSYLTRYSVEHCFETPNLHVLDKLLMEHGLKVCFMAEYFLPDLDHLSQHPCGYPLRVLERGDFAELYSGQWKNALCSDRRELDVLGVGAYDGETLVGLAACSADCETMWQIGVDVLPSYRRRGIAAGVTSALALEILKRGKVPFYCAAWSNVASVRNAIRCGFRPAWVELTARERSCVEGLNGEG